MRSVLLSFTVAVLLGLSWAEEGGAPTGGLFGGRFQGVVEPRLAANAIRIHDLEKHIEKIKGRLEDAKHADPQVFLHDLEARLGYIEGNHCDDHEFQCGNNGQECINDLFVCDGHVDCHNGHDEDDAICDASGVKAGTRFSGTTHWKDCLTLGDHPTHITITGTRRAHFFSARIGVRAVVSSEFKDDHGEEQKKTYDMHGGYNFADRRLYLVPTHDYGQASMALACVFDHGDFERLDCHLQTEGSEHVCADVHLTLEHHDFDEEHHEDEHEEEHDDDDDHHDDPRYQKPRWAHDDDDDDDDDDHHGDH